MCRSSADTDINPQANAPAPSNSDPEQGPLDNQEDDDDISVEVKWMFSWVDRLAERLCGNSSNAVVTHADMDAVLRELRERVERANVEEMFLKHKSKWDAVAKISMAGLKAVPFGEPLAIIFGVIYDRGAQVNLKL